jgi:hypothetical protein
MKKHNLDLRIIKYSEKELKDNCHLFNNDDWYCISFWQKLSESFIEKHSDKLYWKWISKYQNLSEEFIRKHINKININCLMRNKNLSGDLKYKIKKEIETLKEII